MKIFLVRHAESKGNVDRTVHKHTADHCIELSENGLSQAAEAGEFLHNYFLKQTTYTKLQDVKMWISPYKRTRDTAKIILEKCNKWIKCGVEENFLLAEQQYGLFDGIPDGEWITHNKEAYLFYKKQVDQEGKFWAPLPLGESRFQVAQRCNQLIQTFLREQVENLVLVSHGTTTRAFVMAWLNKTPEWFDAEENPNNCSIRLLENKIDHGYIFKGF